MLRKINITLLFVLFLYLKSYCTFTLSGTTISQTGTDSDLSGLASISGVSTYTEGERTIYDIGNMRLWVSGSLTFDGRDEAIISAVSDLALRIRSTGNLTINCFHDDGTDKQYLELKVFSTNIPTGTALGRFYMDANATLNMNGGWIETKDVASPEAHSNVYMNIEYGVFGSYDSDGHSVENQFRVNANDVNITGTLVLIKLGFTVRQVQLNDINAIDSRFSANAFFISGTSPNVDNEFKNVSILGDGDISRLWSGKRIVFPNAEKGTDYSVSPNSPGHTGSTGLVEFRKEVSPTVKDPQGNAIENVLIYVPYFDDGNRVNGNGHTYTTLESVSASTNANGELANPLSVILGAYNEPTYDATPDIFYLSKNGDNSDIFTFHFFEYGKLFAFTDKELKGINELEFDWTLFDDPNVTQTTKATVDAYTEIDNLDKLYDRAKSWKANTANVEHPSIDSLLAMVDVSTLDLGNHDLIINKNATSAFSVDKANRTITIKADTLIIGDKFSSIRTTGTISTQNGSQIEFGYEDDSGIHKFVHLDWNQNTTQNITVENLSTSTAIINSVSATEVYKGHFLMPNPAPAAGIQVEIASPGGFTLFQEEFPEDDLNFIRLDITLNASEEKQEEMLYLAKKILQKSEGINEALTGSTPSITDNTTVTNSNASATNENQEAILQLLRRVLNKVSANREAFEE